MASISPFSEIIIVTEGTNEYGGYILKAKGRVFSNFIEVLNAFPDAQVALVQATTEERLKMTHRERAIFGSPRPMARDVDFKLFEE